MNLLIYRLGSNCLDEIYESERGDLGWWVISHKLSAEHDLN